MRDNIHSFDLVEAFAAFVRAPRVGEVYNIGGSRHCNCSMLEAIALCEEISGRKLSWEYVEDNRIGDHIWWISDVRKFREHYPEWNFRYGLREILEEIHASAVNASPRRSAILAHRGPGLASVHLLREKNADRVCVATHDQDWRCTTSESAYDSGTARLRLPERSRRDRESPRHSP